MPGDVAAPPRGGPVRPRVLVFGRDAGISSLLHFTLEGDGFEVSVVTSAEAMARAVRSGESRPDVLVIDAAKPPHAFAMMVEAQAVGGPRLPPIVMSLSPPVQPAELDAFLRQGAITWVQKPYTLSDLVNTLRTIAAGRFPGQSVADDEDFADQRTA